MKPVWLAVAIYSSILGTGIGTGIFGPMRSARAGGDPPALDYSLNGAAALSGCSGSLFRLEGQSLDDAALVLTNGHCIGLLGTYEVLVHQPVDREVSFYDRNDTMTPSYRATEIVYATMHETDMAILRLAATYREIEQESAVDALILSDQRGELGEDIAVVSGLWEYVASCRLDGFVHEMRESRYTWHDSLRYTQECVTFGGTSGSPVISVTSGRIIGVNNTGYEGGEACSLNNPCEIDEAGEISTIPDGSYGQQTYQLYACMSDSFELQLDRAGCALPRPSGVLRIANVELRADEECDGDGNLDAGESAVLAVSIANDGVVALERVAIAASSTSPGLTFPSGASLELPAAVEPGDRVTAEIAVALAADAPDLNSVEVAVVVSDPAAAEPEISAASAQRVNVNDVPNSSNIDDVESHVVVWNASIEPDDGSGRGWARERAAASNTVWHAVDLDERADQQLESPPLAVGAAPLSMRISHRFQFEASPDTFWDGGVIELSTDGGATWVDAAELVSDAGYGGTLSADSGNPLGGRPAYVGQSGDWPDRSPATLDFGTQFAGQTIRVRFRVGTDAAAGGFGWEIDDIEFIGIENRPFSTVEADPDACGDSPGDDGTGDDGTGDDGTGVDDGDPADPGAGCGCQVVDRLESGSSRAAAGLMLLIFGLLALRRRRHRAR